MTRRLLRQSGITAVALSALVAGGLVIRHFSWRSEEQYLRKIRNGQAAYAATKAGVHMLTRHLAHRLAREHITVNAIGVQNIISVNGNSNNIAASQTGTNNGPIINDGQVTSGK